MAEWIFGSGYYDTVAMESNKVPRDLYLIGSILDTYYTYQVSCQLVECFWK